MSFSDDINKPNLNKFVVIEIDIPIIPDAFINYKSGLWWVRLLEDTQTLTDDQGVDYFFPSNVVNVPNQVGSCLVDSEFYTKVSSVALMESTNKSFYYDTDEGIFYIHFDSYEPPINKIVRIGVVTLFSQKGTGYLSDLYVEPRVTKVPSLSETKDPIFFGVQKFQSGGVSFINTDGFFDSYNDLNIYGQPARIKVGLDGYDYDDLEQVFEGFIEDYSYGFSDFSIKIQDKRKNLSRKIPYNQFSQDEFGDLNDDDIGKWKPVVFGKAFYYPVVCLNKDESSPTNRTFMFLDTEFGDADFNNGTQLKAYVKNEDDSNIYDEVTVASIDTSSGTIDILRTNIDNDDNVPRDLFVTAIGYSSTDDAYEALIYIIDNFSSISFDSVFFNTTEISIELSSSRDIGVFVKKPESIIDIIGDLMFADDGYFYVQKDGRYSVKKFDPDRASTETIQNYRWILDPSFSYNTGEFLSSVTIQAKKHYARNKFLLSPTNTDYEDEVLFKYKKYKSKEFKTILNDNTDAEEKAENIMLQTKDIVRQPRRVGDMSLYDIDVMDIVTTSHKRQSEDELNEEWQVIGKTFDLTNFQITLKMQYWGTA